MYKCFFSNNTHPVVMKERQIKGLKWPLPPPALSLHFFLSSALLRLLPFGGELWFSFWWQVLTTPFYMLCIYYMALLNAVLWLAGHCILRYVISVKQTIARDAALIVTYPWGYCFRDITRTGQIETLHSWLMSENPLENFLPSNSQDTVCGDHYAF